MYAKLYGATLHGIDGCIITVASQKQGAVGIIKYDFCRVLVNGF